MDFTIFNEFSFNWCSLALVSRFGWIETAETRFSYVMGKKHPMDKLNMHIYILQVPPNVTGWRGGGGGGGAQLYFGSLEDNNSGDSLSLRNQKVTMTCS